MPAAAGQASHEWAAAESVVADVRPCTEAESAPFARVFPDASLGAAAFETLCAQAFESRAGQLAAMRETGGGMAPAAEEAEQASAATEQRSIDEGDEDDEDGEEEYEEYDTHDTIPPHARPEAQLRAAQPMPSPLGDTPLS